MAHTPEEIIEAALRLPAEERADLAARLIASLDEEAENREIARRIRELDAGAVTPIPWSRARREILGPDDAPGER